MLALTLALRYARARPARTLVTLLGIAAGVAGLRAIDLGTRGALDSVKAAFEEAAGPATLAVTPAGDTAAPLPDGVLARLDADRDVEVALPLVQVPTLRVEELNGWAAPLYPGEVTGLLVLGVDYAREKGRGRFRVSEGGPVEGAAVFAGERWAKDRNLKPGDPLRLVAGDSELRLTLAGYLPREGLGTRNLGQVVIAPIDVVRRGFGLAPGEAHEAALVVKDARLDAVAQRLGRELGPGVAIVRPAERGKDVAARLGNIRAGTDLTSSLALFISAFLIFGLYTTAAAERRRETGMLRCVGATRLQATVALVLEAALCAVPGVLLGAGLGAVLAEGVAATFSRVSGAEVRLPPADPGGALRAALIGLAVAMASALWPAIRAARQPPFEAVRARSAASERPPRLATLGWLVAVIAAVALLVKDPPRTSSTGRTYALGLLLIAGCAGLMPGIIGRFVGLLTGPAARLFGGGTALGVAGARWRPVRSGLAAGAVLSAVAMVGGLSAVGAGVRQQMGDWADHALGWDLFVRRPGGLDAAALEQIQRTPGVLRVSPVAVRPAEIVTRDDRHLSLSVVGISPASYADDNAFTFTEGTRGHPAELVRALDQPGNALVTAVLAQQMGVRAGDEITLQTPAGPRPLKVLAEIVDYTQNGFSVIVSEQLLARDFALKKADLAAVRLAPDADAARVSAALGALKGVRLETRTELRARVMRMVDEALGAMDGLLLLSSVVGLLAVGSSVALSAIERRADIAALRSLGMSRAQVGAMICAEAVVTALVGAAWGVGAGIFLGWVFAESTHRIGFPIPYEVPWRALGLAALAVIGAALPAAFLPARRAAQIPPAEALREA